MKIEPGPELDRAVAEALGFTVFNGTAIINGKEVPHQRPRVRMQEGNVIGIGDLPEYSTDLNAAFAAAEEVGLFKQYGYCEASGQYVISKTVPVRSWVDALAFDETPALAICAAILKLKESS